VKRRGGRQAGFTLIEVVAAFVIFVLASAAVYEVLFGAVRRSTQSAVQAEAWLVAQSLRDQRAATAGPWPARSEGEVPGGWKWIMKVSPREVEGAALTGLLVEALTVEVWRPGDKRPMAVLQSTELLRRPP
jgi:prepilin-type N-terminal cleavage/methylation domain-containing protein